MALVFFILFFVLFLNTFCSVVGHTVLLQEALQLENARVLNLNYFIRVLFMSPVRNFDVVATKFIVNVKAKGAFRVPCLTFNCKLSIHVTYFQRLQGTAKGLW